MASIKDMAFDYSLQRCHGKKSYEHYMAGARAVIRKIQEAYNISGIETMVDQINSFIEELKEK